MTEANREIISSSRFAAAERLTEQIKAGVKRLLDEEMFWRCNSDCYSRDAPTTPSTLHSRQCGLEAFLSSRRISHFLFLPPYLFIYLPFFLIPVHLLGIVQGPLSHCVFSTPVCPFLPTPSSSRQSPLLFCSGWEKGPVMSHLTEGKAGGPL